MEGETPSLVPASSATNDSELSRSEPEQGDDLRADNPKVEIELIDSTPDNQEPSQSQLRKQPEESAHHGLPAWPTNKRKSQSKGLRVRATKEQMAVLEEQIQSRVEQGLKTTVITRELSPWCGQSESTLAIRIRQIRTRVEAGQEVAA
jgi:hypothetical protein